MAKKEKYEVWIAFKDYRGELYDKEVIAVFFSKIRAMDYVKYCRNEVREEAFSIKFGIDEAKSR